MAVGDDSTIVDESEIGGSSQNLEIIDTSINNESLPTAAPGTASKHGSITFGFKTEPLFFSTLPPFILNFLCFMHPCPCV